MYLVFYRFLFRLFSMRCAYMEYQIVILAKIDWMNYNRCVCSNRMNLYVHTDHSFVCTHSLCFSLNLYLIFHLSAWNRNGGTYACMHAYMVRPFTRNWLWKAARLAFVSHDGIHRFWMIDKFISSKFWPKRREKTFASCRYATQKCVFFRVFFFFFYIKW